MNTDIRQAIAKRYLILDGAMGTMIQNLALGEADFRGDLFREHRLNLAGCNDVLCLTRPDDITAIHRQYIEAGADIITCNSFNANTISLEEYGLADYADTISRAAVRAARRAVEETASAHVWIAGSIGPTNKSLSMSALSADISFEALYEAYLTQAEALIGEGADLLLIETVFDTLNAKAAIRACGEAMIRTGRTVPVMISATLTENGRTLSGQTVEAFIASVSHCKPLTVGLNCGFGPMQLGDFLTRMSDSGLALSFHPNAGLPDAYGKYSVSPAVFADEVSQAIRGTGVRIAGGCCGTTPAHIAALARALKNLRPAPLAAAAGGLYLSGLERVTLPDVRVGGISRVGERCNVAGSRKFLRLIREGKGAEAVEIARRQVECGAVALDVNLDDGMLDARAEMASFLELLAADPVASAVPVMIDSSSWEVIEEGLRHLQGKGIVNSISLKDGEEEFLRRARHIRSMGAAVVVMAMDENGQADSYERRMEIVRRAYSLLTSKAGFPASDIIFDPNVLTVATGIPEHNSYAADFIRAARSIKSEMPGVHVSGGISNLSFAFRGIEPVRKAMHAVFTDLCPDLDMAIVNPAASLDPADYPAELCRAARDVIVNSDPDATGRLTALALEVKARADEAKAAAGKAPAPAHQTPAGSPGDALAEKIMQGTREGISELIEARLGTGEGPLHIVEHSLMAGIGKVGELFGAGRMFLPQVVRSADAMQYAVDILEPHISASAENTAESAPRVVLATVKGDVHDIGKNIVGILLRCNGFKVWDLGTKQPAEAIIAKAREIDADLIALSGLITPSLQEMVNVGLEMQRSGFGIPLFVGGAATSPEYAAVRIAPAYHGPVFHTYEAASLPALAKAWLDPATRAATESELRERQDSLRKAFRSDSSPLMSLEAARAKAPAPLTDVSPMAAANAIGLCDIEAPLAEVGELINWRQFLAVWQIDASLASVADIRGCGHCRAQWLASQPEAKRAKAAEAMHLHEEAVALLSDWISRFGHIKARTVTAEAFREGDDIVLTAGCDSRITIPTLRRQRTEGDTSLALADYVAEAGCGDRVTLFAVTVGQDIKAEIDRIESEEGDYRALLARALADRLAEAATEWLHRRVSGGKGIRPAIGYQSLPDQSLVFEADRLLHYSDIGIEITENGAMYPQATTTGMFIYREHASYFTIGNIGTDQLEDYAARRKMNITDMRRFLRCTRE